MNMKTIIEHNGHEYHLENTNSTDIEVYLDGMFVHSFTNICSAIGHCIEQRNLDVDLQYVQRNR